jgi:flagella basal body P-ring formation protein FlgA
MRSSGKHATPAFLLGLAVLGATTRAGAAPGRVVVAREATIAGDSIRLGDIALLDGEGARALEGVVLGTAPAAGESRVLPGTAVLAALGRAADLHEITYTIPAAVRVRRATQQVTEADVRQLLDAYLAEHLAGAPGDVVVRSVELSGPIQVPEGSYTARIVPAQGMPLLGRVRLQVEFVVGGRAVKTTWIAADVGLYGPVVVVRRPIARGETLAADDVAVDRRDLSELPRDVLVNPAEAKGRATRVPLAPATVVRREQLSDPAAVHRGDIVLLVAERRGLRVTAPGEVREEAGVGQQVRVVNRASRRDVVGRVVDGNTVVVEF